jgi:hypothetical protein
LGGEEKSLNTAAKLMPVVQKMPTSFGRLWQVCFDAAKIIKLWHIHKPFCLYYELYQYGMSYIDMDFALLLLGWSIVGPSRRMTEKVGFGLSLRRSGILSILVCIVNRF